MRQPLPPSATPAIGDFMEKTLKTERTRALGKLGEAGAPRVMNPTAVRTWLGGAGIDLSLSAMVDALTEWQALGLVEKIRRGIYLNLRAHPRPMADEAAPFLRTGAVISLQRVLGQAGVLNNPTDWITCVLPVSASRAVGTIETDRHVFQFAGMKDEMMPSATADWATDAYQPYAHVPTATPEKALLDWIYLSKASPLWRLPPRQDIEMDDLDSEKLARLAIRMDLEKDLSHFIENRGPRSELRRRSHP